MPKSDTNPHRTLSGRANVAVGMGIIIVFVAIVAAALYWGY
jgi:hypothetical protein